RLGGHADPMTLRRCTIEHPFGTLKAWMGHTHFLIRRLKNVRTEMALNVLAYNTKRVVALIGIRGLMRAIPA
ncbi:transposase, partial [Rhodovulum sulfidophilum]|uniref:transposase n=1 Tax=Rhodovulum sulfidophilum TaxID=35806 RepID=UPI0019216467